MKPRGFDRLARVYRALEFLAYGGALERARFCHLERLADCRDILILGEGDGRALARLVRIAPQARLHCLDASPGMIAQARERLGEAGAPVRWEAADALTAAIAPARYDGVVTFFFLDCFRPGEAAGLSAKIGAALRPGAVWLWADFVVPERGWRRWRARVSVWVLYRFFRWQTGLSASELPPAEELIAAAGLRREAAREFSAGMVRSSAYRK